MSGPKPLSSSSLPIGCRFYPSEEQLLCYYLKNKIDNTFANGGGDALGRGEGDAGFYGYDLIRELDLYDCDPFDLPEVSCFPYGYGGRKRHWYCYTTLSTIGGTEENARKIRRRKVKSGYWRRKGRIRNVFANAGKHLLGTRTTFIFYLGSWKKDSRKTDWVLQEFSLLGHLKDSFVVCRVFVKSHHRHNTSENGLSSCAEESFSAGPHIGIQHDEYIAPNVDDVKLHDNTSVEKEPNSAYVSEFVNDPNENHVMTTLSPASQFSLTVQSYQQGSFPRHPERDAMFSKLQGDEYLRCILEEDFIELDDLIK